MPAPPSDKSRPWGVGNVVANYVIATRPWTFTASVMPMLLTAVLRKVSLLSWPFLCALASGISVQAAANLTNTYFDFVSGRDTKKDSGDRALVDRTVSSQGVAALAVVLYALSIALASAVLPTDSKRGLVLGGIVFVTGVLLSIFYTAAPLSLKCKALGDVVIFVCFGPLLMQFTAVLISPNSSGIQWDIMPYTVPLGLLTEAILHANNTRDIDMDRKSGTVTLAGLLGFNWSRVAFIAMLVLSYLSSIALAARGRWGNAMTLITAPLAVDIIRRFTPTTMAMMPERVAQLHMAYGLLTVIGVYIS